MPRGQRVHDLQLCRHPPVARNCMSMRKPILTIYAIFCLSSLLCAQNKRLWILRASGEASEYDPPTFTQKQTVKFPAEVAGSPQNFSVNHLGQMLFAAPVSLPLAEGDLAAE